MKKNVIASAVLSVIVIMCACKQTSKPDEQTSPASASQATTETAPAATDASSTKRYIVTATPDSVVLGKNNEALIRLKDMKAIELSDADGKNTGMELTYKIELTNKTAIGGDAIGLATTNFRLELDNGNKIAPASVFVGADPEATKLSEDDKFTIPPGAKPTALDLFYNETRASVKLELK